MSDPNTPTPTLPEPSLTPQRNLLSCEDFWTEEATATLIAAWGQRHVELNKGNLRSKHWQKVADAVNSRHPYPPRTDLQCKNRMDTLKKKYKTEISKIVESKGEYSPTWPFFLPLDQLISYSAINLNNNNNRNINDDNSNDDNSRSSNYNNTTVKKRSYLEIAMEAAAAAAGERGREGEEGKGKEEEEGLIGLAKVIEKLGEVYERVEAEKRRQRMEIEKQRLEFVKEMECQRMQMMVEMHVQLQRRVKRARKDGTSDEEEKDEEEDEEGDEEEDEDEEDKDGVAVDLLGASSSPLVLLGNE